ncbi:hypothetical protein [Alteromonas sp. ASW11-130]|uniref:hypothetical protein n=1 Tax=Alteromonas sp. ASW11-130 TaxID=3015775 RepID=UPI00224209A8|nr:hypothetical protein [Alteromonas sp. ASW11-130]MCW8091022.1 hypothetical protein [Alteromonas sp. ASW11-130]
MSSNQFDLFPNFTSHNATEQNLLKLAYHSGMRKGNCLEGIDIFRISIVDGQETNLKNASFVTLGVKAMKGKKTVQIHLTSPMKEVILNQLEYRKKTGDYSY